MLIPLIVFCVVVHGIAGTGDLKQVERVGVKSLIYFEVVTSIALVLGLALAFWFEPGVGMKLDPKALDPKPWVPMQRTPITTHRGRLYRLLAQAHPHHRRERVCQRRCAAWVLLFSIVWRPGIDRRAARV